MEFDVTIEIPEGFAQQVRGGPRDRPDPARPHAVHLDQLPGRLRLRRGHPRRGRRPARRAGAARRSRPSPAASSGCRADRHVPDDRRGRRRRQGAVRARGRPALGAHPGHRRRRRVRPPARSSTSSRSTRTSSPASRVEGANWVGRAEAEAEIHASVARHLEHERERPSRQWWLARSTTTATPDRSADPYPRCALRAGPDRRAAHISRSGAGAVGHEAVGPDRQALHVVAGVRRLDVDAAALVDPDVVDRRQCPRCRSRRTRGRRAAAAPPGSCGPRRTERRSTGSSGGPRSGTPPA